MKSLSTAHPEQSAGSATSPSAEASRPSFLRRLGWGLVMGVILLVVSIPVMYLLDGAVEFSARRIYAPFAIGLGASLAEWFWPNFRPASQRGNK